MSVQGIGFNNSSGMINKAAAKKAEGLPAMPSDKVQIGVGNEDSGILDLGPRAPEKSFLNIFGIGKMKPEAGYEGVRKTSRALRDGKMTEFLMKAHSDNLEEQLKAVARKKDNLTSSEAVLKDMVGVLTSHEEGESQFPIDTESISGLLQSKAGFKVAGQGRLSLDFEHHFEMDYDSQGRFRGSHTSEFSGKTEVLQATVLQREGASEKDPAAVLVTFVNPGHMGISFKGSPQEGRSSGQSLFFVDSVGLIDDLTGLLNSGDSKAPLGEVNNNATSLFNSLDEHSELSFHNFGRGYGRVGTSYSCDVNLKNLEGDFSTRQKTLAGTALLERILTDDYGIKPSMSDADLNIGIPEAADIGMKTVENAAMSAVSMPATAVSMKD